MENLNVEKYRKMLLKEKEILCKEIEAMDEDLSYSDVRTGQNELADYDQHPADQGTDTFEKERDVSVRESWRDVVGRIDEAIGKIDRGTYGECDRCGRRISEARLNAVPHAIYCVECQDIIESR
ncbi:MAG: TraR/DksA C4-type zinc finger protein [Armatimonadota bacterium]